MLKRYHRVVGGVFRLVDASVVGLVWVASYWLRLHLPLIEVTKAFPPFETYAALTPLVMILWIVSFSAMKVYHSHRMLRRTHEAHLILKAHAVTMLLFIALTYLVSEYKYSRGVMLYFGVLSAFLLVVFRLSLRNALRSIRKRGYNLRHVLIVGEGKAVDALVARMDKFPELGLRVMGAVVHETSNARTVAGKRVLGNLAELPRILSHQHPDQVVIALPRAQYGELDRVLRDLADETATIQLVPDVHEYVTLGCQVEDFDGHPIVNLNDSPLNEWGSLIKRITDVVFSGLALIFLAPVFALIAILVKLSSPGPVFFRQVRMGLDGRTFDMIKFRTMRADAEKVLESVLAERKARGEVPADGRTITNDPRRTRIGSILRATSLDEIPQFWNVFRGDMSLVGPRPEEAVFVQRFRHQVPHYMLRHKVKAGITGWAQVNGWRGDTSLDKRIECDLYYIRNWSYLLDWKILVMTVWKGFAS